MHRLFVALRPPRAIRAQLMTAMEGVASARWQDDEQLHITVRYIGEVERPVGEDIALALSQVRASAPDVAIRGVGVFEKNGRIDTLWAGVTPPDALLALHRKVDQALVRIGLEPERRAYVPHITLARMPRSAGFGPGVDRWRADQALLSSEPFSLDALILYESVLTRDGAVYEPVARWPLDTQSDYRR
jgi:2'-5' RNA ligase